MSFVLHSQTKNSQGVIQSILLNTNTLDFSFKKIAMYSMKPLAEKTGDSIELKHLYNDDDLSFEVSALNGSDCMTVEYLFGDSQDIDSVFDKFNQDLFTSHHILSTVQEMDNYPFVILAQQDNKATICSNIDAYDTELSLVRYENENRLCLVAGQAYDDSDIIYTLTSLFSCLPDFKGFKIPELHEQQEDLNEYWKDSDLNAKEKLESFDMNFGENPEKVFKNPEFFNMIRSILNQFFIKNEFNTACEYETEARGLLKFIDKVNTYKQLPEFNKVKLVYIYETSNKEYSLTLSGNSVDVEYGGIGKKLKKETKSFDNHQKAIKFFKDKFLSKFKEGYEIESYS